MADSNTTKINRLTCNSRKYLIRRENRDENKFFINSLINQCIFSSVEIACV